MHRLWQQALNKADIGIIILDRQQSIKFWNEKMESISKLSMLQVQNKTLHEICPKFSEPRYQSFLQGVFHSGQCRFCSSSLHKAFVWPQNGAANEHIRQNLRMDPITANSMPEFLMLQITDITEQAINEQNQRMLIQDLMKGYQRIKESEEAIREKAKYDMLTGLLNRQLLEHELKSALQTAQKELRKTALLFIDLDGFKKVNDQYGHVVGDVLLQQVAGRLKSNTRHAKDRPTDTIARIGGDEFLLWIHPSAKNDAEGFAKRIVTAVGKPYYIDNMRIKISVSVGIALYPDDASNVKALIKCSDKAMYQIKQTTKNNYCFYSA